MKIMLSQKEMDTLNSAKKGFEKGLKKLVNVINITMDIDDEDTNPFEEIPQSYNMYVQTEDSMDGKVITINDKYTVHVINTLKDVYDTLINGTIMAIPPIASTLKLFGISIEKMYDRLDTASKKFFIAPIEESFHDEEKQTIMSIIVNDAKGISEFLIDMDYEHIDSYKDDVERYHETLSKRIEALDDKVYPSEMYGKHVATLKELELAMDVFESRTEE